jgi:aminopeptidase YwaD
LLFLFRKVVLLKIYLMLEALFLFDTLTSPYFAGRGVVEDGEAKAAQWIAEEFSKFGLSKIGPSFFQSFFYPINTFPGDVEVQLDNKSITAGVDFLVEPNSCKNAR